jgi:hypothetical protein
VFSCCKERLYKHGASCCYSVKHLYPACIIPSSLDLIPVLPSFPFRPRDPSLTRSMYPTPPHLLTPSLHLFLLLYIPTDIPLYLPIYLPHSIPYTSPSVTYILPASLPPFIPPSLSTQCVFEPAHAWPSGETPSFLRQEQRPLPRAPCWLTRTIEVKQTMSNITVILLVLVTISHIANLV